MGTQKKNPGGNNCVNGGYLVIINQKEEKSKIAEIETAEIQECLYLSFCKLVKKPITGLLISLRIIPDKACNDTGMNPRKNSLS